MGQIYIDSMLRACSMRHSRIGTAKREGFMKRILSLVFAVAIATLGSIANGHVVEISNASGFILFSDHFSDSQLNAPVDIPAFNVESNGIESAIIRVRIVITNVRFIQLIRIAEDGSELIDNNIASANGRIGRRPQAFELHDMQRFDAPGTFRYILRVWFARRSGVVQFVARATIME